MRQVERVANPLCICYSHSVIRIIDILPSIFFVLQEVFSYEKAEVRANAAPDNQ